MRPTNWLTLVFAVLLCAATLSLAACVEVGAEDIPDWVPEWILPQAQIPETHTPEPPVEPDDGRQESGAGRFGRPATVEARVHSAHLGALAPATARAPAA